ncbi:MAG: acyltransferase [Bulleidia sp.]|nr:acyltransferase [Bulleidia sp.]
MTTERNHGIDELRLLSMFYIVLMHSLLQGGILYHAEYGSVAYAVSWLLEIICFVSVDCFALISGYVGYSDQPSKFHFSRWLSLWLEVVFYNLIIAMAMHLKNGVPNVQYYQYALLPVTAVTYWYFTAYTALFFCIPLLNEGIRALSEKQLTMISCMAFLLFSVIETIRPVFGMNNGYSFLWLFVLYLFGAALKRLRNHLPGSHPCILCISVCTFILWVLIMSFGIGTGKDPNVNNRFLSYTSPFVLLSAASYVILFSRKKISEKKKAIISRNAGNAFAIYLLDTQPYFFNHMLAGAFEPLLLHSVFLMLAVLLISSFLFSYACLIIDQVRTFIFEKLNINRFCLHVESQFGKFADILLKNF